MLFAVAYKNAGGMFYAVTLLAIGGVLALYAWSLSFVFAYFPKVEGGKPFVRAVVAIALPVAGSVSVGHAGEAKPCKGRAP